MIERDGPLSLSRQCALLGVSRSSQYYRPKGESAEDLALMRRMDELHMAYPQVRLPLGPFPVPSRRGRTATSCSPGALPHRDVAAAID